jgi:hypothetical protein
MTVSTSGKWGLVALAAVVITAAALLPALRDDGGSRYGAESQRLMFRDGDLVVLAAGRPDGDWMRYRVADVWRNRTGHPLPWAAGTPIPELDARIHAGFAFAPAQVAFFRKREGGFTWIGSLMATDGTIRLRIDDDGNPAASVREVSLEQMRAMVRLTSAPSGR